MKLQEKFDKLQREYNKLQAAFRRLEELLFPAWFTAIRSSNTKDRSEALKLALDGISSYHKGEVTEQGKALVSEISENWDFIGFTPSVAYTRGKGKDLNTVFIHPWGQRTLLFKHKEMPILMITNSSIKLNESALALIEGNKNLEDSEILDVEGLTG